MSQRVTGRRRQACVLQQVLVQAEHLDVAERPLPMLGLGGREPARDHGEQPVAGGQEVGKPVVFGFRERPPIVTAASYRAKPAGYRRQRYPIRPPVTRTLTPDQK
jgi:hypothetical protein